jgi:hypothetical protein
VCIQLSDNIHLAKSEKEKGMENQLMRKKNSSTKLHRSLIPGIIVILMLVSLTSSATAQDETAPDIVAPVSPQQNVDLWGGWLDWASQHQIGEQLVPIVAVPVSQHEIDTWQAKVDFYRIQAVLQHMGELLTPSSFLFVSQHEIDTWQAKVDFYRS